MALRSASILALALTLAGCATPPPPPPAPSPVADQGIGYPTPAAALQALRARPDVLFYTQNGWLIADDRTNMTVWSFSPPGDPTFPTAVKRQAIQIGSGIYVETKILCGAPQTACAQLPAEFHALDQAIRQNVNPGQN